MIATGQPARPDELRVMLHGLGQVFGALGRALVCLGPDFRILHGTPELDRLAGAGAAGAMAGRPVEELLGPELLGPAGPLRVALERGERREGWGTMLRRNGHPARRVSVTVAPIDHRPGDTCDPGVAYVVVLRPAEEDDGAEGGPPTAFSGLLARSEAMLRLFRMIENLAESEATVLLAGESGTGKELVARALHLHSPRRHGPFVVVNCGAIPGELLESELFGHVRGDFTGAFRDRTGRFELASQGTLFLDEIGDLPLALQVKLLRVLQERTFERVGDNHVRHTEARILAATHQDLRRAVREGRFREDLFYRLRVVPIEIPPLRDRRPIARHVLARVCARYGRALRLAPDAVRLLLLYRWPGNVRELENALEYAVAVCKGQTIHAEDLPAEILEGAVLPPAPQEPETAVPVHPGGQGTDNGRGERDLLRASLDAHCWRRDETAHALGISRTTLWRRMREAGL